MKEKILIVCPQESSSFVQLDASLLSDRFDVEVLSFSRFRKPKILSTAFAIARSLTREKISCIVMWFSVPHLAPVIVLLARLFRVRVVAITGGFDIAYVPVIAWGEMGIWWKRLLQRFTLHRVDRILPFSDFSRTDTLKYAPARITSTLYPGIDTSRYVPSGSKENLIITACNLINTFSITQKGLDVFSKCAEALPEYEFLIIGGIDANDASAREFVRRAAANLKFTERYISDEELLSLYQRAKVYVQVSAHEGFGIACAEAMACECVPVGTTNTSLVEVIGSAGFLVAYKDVPATVDAIRNASVSPLGAEARKRVVENFTVERRRSGLLLTLQQILRK
jgi:glycosyltransferase involved in cell wall biosynthesis